MGMNKTVITLTDLPLRTQALDVDDLVNIFGGCVKVGHECEKDKDCCSLICNFLVDDYIKGHHVNCNL
jgi:hypothetical protein